MWKGEVFHSAAAQYLGHIKSGKYTSLPTSWIDWLQSKVNSEWQFSSSKSYKDRPWQISRKGGLALLEHEYNTQLSESYPDKVIKSVIEIMEKFELWLNSTDLKRKLRSSQKIWIEPNIFADKVGFNLNDVEVITKVDLSILDSDRFYIYDWKTGSKSGASSTSGFSSSELQGYIYQLWPHMRLNIPLEQISAHFIYLGNEQVEMESINLNAKTKRRLLRYLTTEISREYYFNSPDHKHNWSLADLDYSDSVYNCKTCPFQVVCERKIVNE
jgi:hypothetical protein